MGNVGKRNYFLHIMVTAIVVIFCAFSVLLLIGNRPSNKDTSFDSFEKTLSQMQKDYDVLSSAQTYTLNENEYILDNEQLYLSAQSLFSYGIIEETEKEYISSEELNSDNIYVKQNENNVEVQWTPSTNRLIVYTNNNIDNLGAVMSAEYNGWHVFQYQNEKDSESAYNYYLNLNGVDSVSYDVVVHADSVKVQEVDEKEVSQNANSNATYRSWGLDYMGFSSYSDLVLSGNKNKVAVAVLDTGINTSHELFTNGDRILHKYGKNCTDESSPTRYEYEDLNFHGSHTSGVIAQATGSNVKIIPVKVLDYNGDGYASDIVEGLEYVAKIKSSVASDGYALKVINMSLGLKSTAGTSVVSSLTNAVNNAYNAGILPVVSAGNDRKNTVNVCPANVANAVTVSALKKSSIGVLSFDSSYSNYGSAVDFAAPGTGIISCNANPSYGKYKGNYLSADGTSMAAPHVAAAFALAFSNPYGDTSIAAVNESFERNAIDYGSEGKDIYYGYGLINLENVALTNYAGEVNITEGQESDGRKFVQLSYSGEPNYRIYYSFEEDIVSITPKSDSKIHPYSGGKLYIDKTTKISATAFIYENSSFNNLVGQVVNENTKEALFSKIIYIDNYDIAMNYEVTLDGALVNYSGSLSVVKVPEKKVVKYTDNSGNDQSKEVTITSVTTSAFNGTNVTKVILPKTLTSIGERAFYYNTKITEIDASNIASELTIGNYAFTSCTNLQNLILGNTRIVKIGNYAFRYVSKLTELNVEYVREIGDYAFADCTGFNKMEFLNIESIGKYAFSKSSISKLHLGPNIASIGSQNYLKIQEFYGHKNTVAESFAYQNNISFFDMTLRTSRNVNGNSIISVGNNFVMNFVISGQKVYAENLNLSNGNTTKALAIPSNVTLKEIDSHEYLVSVNVSNSNFGSIGNYVLKINFSDEFNDSLTIERNIKVVSASTPTISLEYEKDFHFSVFINGEEYTDSTVLYQGEQYTFEFVAESGYGLPSTIKINGEDYTLRNGRVDYKPTTDVTITMEEPVRLEKADISFTYNSSLGWFDVVSSQGEKVSDNLVKVSIGRNLQFKAFPVDGYVVSYVTANGKTLEAVDGVYSIGNITSNQEIVIAFERAVYNINSLSLGKGGTYSQQLGDDSKLRIVANEGYEIEFVMVNGKIVSLIGDTLYLDPGDSDIVISFTDSTGIFGDTSGVAIKYMIVLIVIIVVYIAGRVILYFVLKAQDKKNPKKISKK